MSSSEKRLARVLFAAILCFSIFSACTRKSDFIDEGSVGSGVHYYPVIISDNLFDTLTGKFLNLTDTIFSPSQQLIFELDFYSQDAVDSFRLWVGPSPGKLVLGGALGSDAAGYSFAKGLDTVLFHCVLPANEDSLDWYIVPCVVTVRQLETHLQSVIHIQ